MDDLLFFLIDRHLRPMLAIADELGDGLVNSAPELPGANTPYQLVFHCCGMLEWWSRHSVLGEQVDRDRAAEFDATGTVAELRERVEQVTFQLAADAHRIQLDAPLRGGFSHYGGTPLASSARSVMLHVLEELAQHHGHLELTRDLLVANADRTT